MSNRGWFAWDVLAVVAFAWALFVALDALQAVLEGYRMVITSPYAFKSEN